MAKLGSRWVKRIYATKRVNGELHADIGVCVSVGRDSWVAWKWMDADPRKRALAVEGHGPNTPWVDYLYMKEHGLNG